jgi:hypothetical protein
MRNLSKQLGRKDSSDEQHAGAAGAHNLGQMSAEASDQTGTTPVAGSKGEGSKGEDSARHPDISKDDIRDRKVDPEAVRESFKEAELDPIAESEPEEGEKAA